MVTYRTAKGYEGKFGRGKDSAGVFQAKNYLSYQVQTWDIDSEHNFLVRHAKDNVIKRTRHSICFMTEPFNAEKLPHRFSLPMTWSIHGNHSDIEIPFISSGP